MRASLTQRLPPPPPLPCHACAPARRQALGLPDHVKLLPESAADKQLAAVSLMQQAGTKFQHNWQKKRRAIMTESIFGGAGGGAAAAAPSSAAAGGLQQRVLASKRRKQQ